MSGGAIPTNGGSARESPPLRTERRSRVLERLALPERIDARYVFFFLLIAGSYYGAAKFGLQLAYANTSITSIWPPTGIALAALVLLGRRFWPAVFIGALFANLWTGVPLVTTLGIATGNTLEALVGAYLLCSVTDFRPSLERARDVVLLALLAGGVSTAVSATIGVTSLWIGNQVDANDLDTAWRVWWLGDMGGDLLVAPFLMVVVTIWRRHDFPVTTARVVEAVALTAVLAGVSVLAFSGNVPITYVVFPPLIWAALRFRQIGATTGSLIVATVAVLYTAGDMGPFVRHSQDDGLLLAQTFVGVAAITTLLLAAIMSERERAEQLFHKVFEQGPVGMVILGPDQRIEETNDSLCTMLGYERGELDRRMLTELGHPDDLDVDAELERELLAGEIGSYQVEKRYFTKQGEVVWANVTATTLSDEAGSPRGLTILDDITRLKGLQTELRYFAEHDPLTGLFNRRRFEDELERHCAYAGRYGLTGALLVGDLDNFKFVNDSFGHRAGDQLVRSVGARMRERLRRTDTIARLGGDEFVVLLPNVTEADAMRVAQELLEAVRDHSIVIEGRRVSATMSIGVCLFRGEELTPLELLGSADLAMYEAKNAGRDRIAVATAPRERAAPDVRRSWHHRVLDALDTDGLVLYWQPIIDLATGRPSQYELLLRMKGSGGRVIPPGSFLHAAERFGTVQAIDRWVAGQAVQLLDELEGAGKTASLEVNLSGRTVGDPDFAEVVGEELARSRVDPARLIFEITETAAIADMEQAQKFAQAIQELGCSFALDDFGTGFGSFYYLKHFPADYLKIDGDFISGLNDSHIDQVVVKSIVQMSRGIEARTVAECVGDAETVERLREYGVDLAQGFYLGMPEPVAVEGGRGGGGWVDGEGYTPAANAISTYPRVVVSPEPSFSGQEPRFEEQIPPNLTRGHFPGPQEVVSLAERCRSVCAHAQAVARGTQAPTDSALRAESLCPRRRRRPWRRERWSRWCSPTLPTRPLLVNASIQRRSGR